MQNNVNIRAINYELAVVMPVYNEDGCIENVINSWLKELEKLGINFLLLVLNDGSCDNTELCLRNFSGDGRVMLINKRNTGHGPTIILGYQLAVKEAEWVFQVDSDDELKPPPFVELWQRKESFDALFGVRVGRIQSVSRKLISILSCAVVSTVFGCAIRDVNIPYRLMRSSLLGVILPHIPANSFAPNVMISGAMTALNQRIYNHSVTHENRKTGTVSIISWKLWKAAFTSFYQTLAFKWRLHTM